MEGSILEFIGTELIGVMSPVSICMLLVVLLVYTLSPSSSSLSSTSSSSQTPIITAANLVYSENPSDSPAQKLEGAALNAVVFVILIAAVTFLLVCLYYYNFTNFLKNYMRLSAFLILGTMGGAIFLSLIQHFNVPIDAISCFVVLFNFAALGVVSVFGKGVPIIVTQCYTVALGIITAAWFTQLPEWTTWVLLVALALYDLVAVLAPGGPLKILVELSQSRDDDLPALVYEARPTVSVSGGGGRRGSLGLLVGGVSDNGAAQVQNLSRNDGQNRVGSGGDGVSDNRSVELQNLSRNDGHNRVASGGGGVLGLLVGGVSDNRSVELQNLPRNDGHNRVGNFGSGDDNGNPSGSNEEIEDDDDDVEGRGEMSPLVPNSWGPPEMSPGVVNEEQSPLVEMLAGGILNEDDDSEVATMSRGIKLGLGDFVFYSVLVGRAAMYDLMTVYACYLAIISGLACTLILLSVCGRALPALPISIALGIIFYFLTRLLMEPFVVQTSTNLLMF